MIDYSISPQLQQAHGEKTDSPESVNWAQYGYRRNESGKWYMPICECVTPVVYVREGEISPEQDCRACGLVVWNTEEESV